VQAGKDWHDWAGWLMMPLALGLLWLEWRYLRALLTDPAPTNPLPMELGGLKTFVPSTPRADVSTPNGVCQPTAAGKDDHVDIKNPTV
jgi:hypothetical protein